MIAADGPFIKSYSERKIEKNSSVLRRELSLKGSLCNLQRCLLSSWSGALCFSRELKSGGAVNLIMKPGLSVKVLIIILIRGTVLQPWAQIRRRGQSHHESRVMIFWLFGTNLKMVQVFRPKTNGDERCDISGENCYAQEQQIMNWYSASFYAL